MQQSRGLKLLQASALQKLRKESRVLLTSAGVAGCIILLRLMGWLEIWELAVLDQGFRLRPLAPVDDRIVIVGVEESDLQRIRKFPIPDAVMARLLEKVKAAKPRAIGLDIYRDLAVEPGHQDLLRVYQTTPNLIGIQQLKDLSGAGVSPPPALAQSNQVGFNNLVQDPDSRVRRGLLYWEVDGKQYQSFALKLSLLYLKKEGINPAAAPNSNYLQLGQAVFSPFAPNDGGYINADDGGYQFLANLHGPTNRFQRFSLSQVLAGEVPPEKLRDRIVLIGSTAVSLKDYFYTSYSSSLPGSPALELMAGVELQANLMSQIISSAVDGRVLLQVWSDPLEWLWILGWAWLGAALSWRLRSPLKTGTAILLAIAGLSGVVYVVFLAGWWIPLFPAAVGLTISAIVIISHIAYLEEELKRSKEFLNSIINSIPDPIYVKDQSHRWIVVNQAFCRFLGYSAENLLEKSDFHVLPAAEAAISYQQDQAVFDISEEYESEAAYTNQAGITHQIATKRSLHKDGAGNVFLVGVMRDITERKRMEDELKRTAADLVRSNQELQQSATRLQHQATHDPLTTLPNRKLFEDRLKQALDWAADNNQQVALLFIDLDGFKSINDTYGHDVGDLLLKAVAQRLTGCLRGSDTVARLGGDEFTVILPAIPSHQDAERVAKKILQTLLQPFSIQGAVINASCSIGVSLYPQDGNDAEALVKTADTAMYQAKAAGKSRYQLAIEAVDVVGQRLH